MESNYSEIEILKEIDEKFASLDQDAQQRVFDYLTDKYKLKGRSATGSRKEPTLPITDSTISLKEFILAKKPDSHYERIACIVFYLEKFKGLEGCKTIDVTNANSEARQPKFPNPALYVQHATNTYGYLIALGKGKKGISARGEAVIEALPDRETLTGVLKAHPMKKKPSRKSKTK
ncbi:MAG TPA: hypothetical protein VFE32_14870 [Puia sp.]|nr:hypothetical protein [Puia sp.]